jgi:hypothetical protein
MFCKSKLSTVAILVLSTICCARRVTSAAAATQPPLDVIHLGDPGSEKAHDLKGDHQELVSDGALGETARRLLPLDNPNWQGGRIDFTMKVDPDKQNYFTAKFWGGEANANRLVLFVDGKQVGYHHIGDVDLLDFGNDSGEAPCPGKFFYNTCPLPLQATSGKNEVSLEIRAMGEIWGYGQTFEQYQKNVGGPGRGIYAVYTHTDGTLVPPPEEKQGAAPAEPPVRSSPGLEVFDELKRRVNHQIDGELRSPNPPNEMQMLFLAKASGVKWTSAYQNPKVVERVIGGLDALYQEWKKNPKLAQDDPVTPNPGWFEFGPAGHALVLLAKPLSGALDQPVLGDNSITRRAAWSALLQAGLDYHIHHRRLYTNQSMITDLNIAWSNRAIETIDPDHALPQQQVMHYLYQSVGLEPWLGSETDDGPEKPTGASYFELTPKGLTKELGYVGYYGEVLDWVTSLYDATRPTPDQPGDERIRKQAVKIAEARARFRYPSVDADGNRAMRIETIVGWRDNHYPGNVTYLERPTWDASALCIAAATADPALGGYVQQMFEDNQYFASVVEQMKAATNLRVTMGLLDGPDEYAAVQSLPKSETRLPMNGPDFAWADEQDGVVAVKHGGDIFYASLYWRARQAINFLARVHDIGPTYERIAVVKEATRFEPSGQMFTRPDAFDPQAPHGVHYPDEIHSAMAGEKLPIAQLPADHTRKPGQEDPAAGRGQFYELLYGDYLIGMNATDDKTFVMDLPPGLRTAKDLVANKSIDCTRPVPVGPQSTIVLSLKAAG